MFSLNDWKVWILEDSIEKPPNLMPQISSNFIFPWYFPILKVWCVWLKQLKILNFGILVWGGSPLWYPQILSNFTFSSYLPILKISLVYCKWLKSNFSVLVWEGCLHFGILKFYQMLFFLVLAYISWKFHAFCVSMVKKFEFWWPYLRGTPSLRYPQILPYFIFNLCSFILKISSV